MACAGATATPSHAFSPGEPLDCAIGATCFVQNHVDRDPGPEARDYRCGLQTYDMHKGVDIRVPDKVAMEAGVDVVAVADGQVHRARDGKEDGAFQIIGREAIEGRDCGNALIIA